MSSVSPIFPDLNLEEIRRQLRDGDEPPYDDGMEARLSVVEQAIVRIDATLPNLATKADIKDSVSSTERWMVATVIGLFIGFGGLFMAMSNALKPTAPAAQQAPIIINVPGPTPAK